MSSGGEAQQRFDAFDAVVARKAAQTTGPVQTTLPVGTQAAQAPEPAQAAQVPEPAQAAQAPEPAQAAQAADAANTSDAADAVEIVDFGRAGEPDRLICGDALDEVAALGDGLIDAIYIDPPFGTGMVQHGRGHSYADRADDPDAFVAWLMPYLEHSRRVLTATGSLFVHLDYRAVHHIKVALDRLFGRDQFVNEIVWCYAVGGKSRRGFGRKHDTILWYARSTDWAFYPDAVRVPRRGGSHMRVVDGVQEKTDRKTGRIYRYPVAAGKVPEDWWTDIETLNHSDRERTGWPSQKPERLVARIVQAVTAPGDHVADWFVGSGTTAAVAQQLGRRFVTVDRASAAIDLCVARLTAQGRQLALQGTPPAPIHVERANKRRRQDAFGP